MRFSQSSLTIIQPYFSHSRGQETMSHDKTGRENILPVPPEILQSLSLSLFRLGRTWLQSPETSRKHHRLIAADRDQMAQVLETATIDRSAPDQTCQRLDFGASCHRPWYNSASSASRIVLLFHQAEEYLIWVGMACDELASSHVPSPPQRDSESCVPVGLASANPGRGPPRSLPHRFRCVQRMSCCEAEDEARTDLFPNSQEHKFLIWTSHKQAKCVWKPQPKMPTWLDHI